MKKFIVIVFLVSFYACDVMSDISRNELHYENIIKNEIPQQFKKILIASYGPSSTKLFVQEISETLKQEIEKKGIIVEEIFLGNDSESSNKNYNSLLLSKEFDGLLFIIPESNSIVTERTQPMLGFEPRSIKQQQRLGFKMFNKKSLDTPIWRSLIRVNINITQSKNYSNIGSKIIKDMIGNYLLPK